MGLPARDIFVISDLHLGDGGVRDNFEAGHKTPQLEGFLDHVDHEGGELFILGDLFELWQVNLSLLFVKRRDLLDRLAKMPLTYIPGNHDIDLIHFIDSDFLRHPFFSHMRQPFIRELGGKKFRFFHGHEVDPFNAGDSPGFGRMLAIFGGIFEDENGSPMLASGKSAEDVLEQFGESMLSLWSSAMATVATPGQTNDGPQSALTPAQNPHRLVEHVNEVREDLKKRDYDVAVVGHTHKPGHIGDWYVNSGSWTGTKNSFLRITPEGRVHHMNWQNGAATEHDPADVLEELSEKSPINTAVYSIRTLFPKKRQALERTRWALIIQGLLALTVGLSTIYTSLNYGVAEGWRILILAFGVFMLIDGVLSVIGATQRQPVKRFLYRSRGVASLLIGALVLLRGSVVEVFAIFVGVWAFVAGALSIASSRILQHMTESRWLKIVGTASLIAGLILLLIPSSAFLLKFALSGYLCIYGVGEILAGIYGRRSPKS